MSVLTSAPSCTHPKKKYAARKMRTPTASEITQWTPLNTGSCSGDDSSRVSLNISQTSYREQQNTVTIMDWRGPPPLNPLLVNEGTKGWSKLRRRAQLA